MQLHDRYQDLKKDRPHLRIRDAAKALSVSEAELVAVSPGTTRLRGDWPALMNRVAGLGRVMALTRNETVVHERRGVYTGVDVEPGQPMGAVVGPDIDLRLFFRAWHAAFATDKGLQVFDAHGDAIHKVHLLDDSDRSAFDALVQELATTDELSVSPRPPKPADRPDAEIDVEGFHEGWANLQNTHEFFGLLRRFGVSRVQALRLGGSFVREVGAGALLTTLQRAAAEAVPVMIFVGNPGCIQIHSGLVKNIKPTDGWTNVLDRDFNLHVKDDRTVSGFVVQKPTKDGIVTALEILDVDQELCVQMFGVRKPGIQEDPRWTDILR